MKKAVLSRSRHSQMSMAYMIYFPIMPNFPNAYYKQGAVLGATKKIKIKKKTTTQVLASRKPPYQQLLYIMMSKLLGSGQK